MKKINLLTKSFILVLLTPIEISKGQRRRNFLKAKSYLNRLYYNFSGIKHTGIGSILCLLALFNFR